jgi:crotonobetaine/carnitine-CoA ligase
MARAPWSEWTLVHLIRRQAAELGDRPFVRFEDGQSFTFRALDAWTDELASSLAALGTRTGDRVLGLVGNRAESIGMLFAAAKLGAVWVPVNTGLRGAFLQHQLPHAVLRGAPLSRDRDGRAGQDAHGQASEGAPPRGRHLRGHLGRKSIGYVVRR